MAGEKGIGLIVLDNFNTPAAFRPEDEALMLSLSQQVALSLENVRLVHAMTERAGQLEALNDVATAITSSLRSDELVAALLDQLDPILPLIPPRSGCVRKTDLTVAAARGFPDPEKRLGLTLAVSDSALVQGNGEERPAHVRWAMSARTRVSLPWKRPRLSWLGIPLIAKGELIGAHCAGKMAGLFLQP